MNYTKLNESEYDRNTSPVARVEHDHKNIDRLKIYTKIVYVIFGQGTLNKDF
eukprot:TRINITY_DN1223_c1_g1_i1.p1 TRINITY_DN1223_c1_g1~~TRINITY_DN1223_c1_g1_i1.p1  ORF type:complete len:52 (-),score=5.42 TRINITY_DN1223_c1_g1_i1:235-390(-)